MSDDSPDLSSTPAETLPKTMQRILLVTGTAGAGKTTALRVLEDLGWEAIDNFPIRLLEPMIDAEAAGDGARPPLAIGFDTRTRGFDARKIIGLVKQLAERRDISIATLFIDCNSAELERRYNETRRRHPQAQGRPLLAGIAAEREMLEPLRRWADACIDTSAYSANDLQQEIRERFADDAPAETVVTISSFGFARGMPPVADLVFDMRFLDNPHWVDGLRELTGRDEPVANHIRKDSAFAPAFERMIDLIKMLLPRYEAQGKSYVHVAFGCTGGRHRSVFTAEQAAQSLREAGFSPTIIHRNLSSRAEDLIEGSQQS